MKEKEDYRDIAGNFFKKMLASQREKSQPLAEWQHEDREYLKNPPFTVGRLYVVKNEFRRFNQIGMDFSWPPAVVCFFLALFICYAWNTK